MVSYLPFAALLLAGSIHCKSIRIVGGENTAIENYPALVQLEDYVSEIRWWLQYCGANILTRTWLLTAAHCYDGLTPEDIRVRAGTTFRGLGGDIHYVENVIVHPEYGVAARADADIAVLKIQTPLIYSDRIQPGIVVRHGDLVPDNHPVVHAGWGDTRFNGFPSLILKDVTIYVINNELCSQRYLELGLPATNKVTENMICAGILDVGGKDACQGDSGGPLYAGEVIVGVVSWGERCANETYPGISTSVASYTNWIIATAR